jgi:hypothetical protein
LSTGQSLDLSQLQGTMVLKVDRKKFNLRATHKETGGAINIEISCDHTVGRTFEVGTTYQQVFNVEMELEHLGAR